MTAEELMNSEKYEPDYGISFQDYHGDMADIVPHMMMEFAQYHVEQALKAASESRQDFGKESIVFNDSQKEQILESYSKENIK